MNLADLRVFLAVAGEHSVAGAAQRLHLTPSAVSKALRRLEEGIGTVLFDRSSRQLVLNGRGEALVERARVLLSLAAQARADLLGEDAAPDWRVAGPAVLLWRDAARIAGALEPYAGATLRLEAMFEDDALVALARGEAGAAVVTGAVIGARASVWSADWECVPLGALVLILVAGLGHPLVAGRERAPDGSCRATVEEVLAHPFACPSRSLFCGARRGTRSDGWRDDELPRTIRYWADDLQLLLAFVRGGEALAYLPEFVLAEPGLVRVHVTGCGFDCTEESWFVWNRSTAPAWLARAASALAVIE